MDEGTKKADPTLIGLLALTAAALKEYHRTVAVVQSSAGHILACTDVAIEHSEARIHAAVRAADDVHETALKNSARDMALAREAARKKIEHMHAAWNAYEEARAAVAAHHATPQGAPQ